MDPRRATNAGAGARQGGGGHASKTSIGSRHAAGVASGVAPMNRKFGGSKASLAPSQGDAENSRKSPLDALSRSTLRQDPMQKRSGLQDVDESFLNANAFARPSRLRHSGLEGQATTLMPPQQMPGATATPMRSAAGAAEQTQMQSQPVPAAQMSNVPPQSMQQQPMQAQQQPPVAAVASQQQQGYVQQPAAGQPSRRDQMPVSNAQPQQAAYEQQQQQQQQQQYQDSTQAQPAAQTSSQPQQQQTQQPITPRKQQQPPPQQAYPPQAPAGYPPSNISAPPPEAEMCTTCPNCQTTIYLVRPDEMGHGDAAAPAQ